MSTTLADLEAGQKARVTGFTNDDALTESLMQMGIVEDTELELVRTAPTGDPIEILVMGYALSLRRAEAARVQVEIESSS